MNRLILTAAASAAIALLSACGSEPPPPEAPRPVLTTEVRYDAARDSSRYAGTVQSRYEVEQAFRVGGKVSQRKVEVGQVVREGDVLAVLDDADYRLAAEAARQQWTAASAQSRQATAERQRLNALKADGSVSASDDERADSGAATASAAEAAQARQLELAGNRVKYTVLRASRSGVVTAVRFEVGQVVAEGRPVVTIADPATPEVVIDVPEDQLDAFRGGRFKATIARAPAQAFEVTLRELSPQAAAQTRTFRARLKPGNGQPLPLGTSATLIVERVANGDQVAALPATALTQSAGQPAVWVAEAAASAPLATVKLVPVQVHGYRNDTALVSGVPAGERVVTAGVHKMSPGLKVALTTAPVATQTQQVER